MEFRGHFLLASLIFHLDLSLDGWLSRRCNVFDASWPSYCSFYASYGHETVTWLDCLTFCHPFFLLLFLPLCLTNSLQLHKNSQIWLAKRHQAWLFTTHVIEFPVPKMHHLEQKHSPKMRRLSMIYWFWVVLDFLGLESDHSLSVTPVWYLEISFSGEKCFSCSRISKFHWSWSSSAVTQCWNV